jgi:hypothetical protein
VLTSLPTHRIAFFSPNPQKEFFRKESLQIVFGNILTFRQLLIHTVPNFEPQDDYFTS